MSDGTATPEPGREPEPDTAAWPQPSATPPPEAPWPAGYGDATGAPAGPAYPDPAQAPPSPYAVPGQQGTQPGYAAGGYPPPAADPYGAAPAGPAPYASAPYGSSAPYPSATPYPSAPYAPGQYAPGQHPSAPSPRTDGVSIAALVTGLLAMAVVPLVLGIVGLRRTKRNGTQGRGLAITGIILGALEIVGWIAVVSVIAFGVNQYQGRIDTLRSECAAGQMASCDDLYQESLPDSDEEQFGWTCGGRTDGGGSCEVTGAVAYGDSAELDALWDACAAGDMAACDELYSSAPTDSEYEEFGDTCGGQTDGGTYCDGGTTDGTDDTGTTDDTGLGDVTGGSYGDDPELDALWDACQAGSGTACDDLYWDSPSGSEYEEFGTTCGGRVDIAWSCEEEIGA